MKDRFVILIVGIILLLLSGVLAIYMNVTNTYLALQFPFVIIFSFGVLLVIGFIIAPRTHVDEERTRIQRERQEQERVSLLQRARNLEEARNFEASALIYERLGMFKEAGRVRGKGQVVKVTRTEVSVNLNSLLRQLRDGGIVVVYRCPNCKAPMRIGKNTRVESLKVCGHCGSEIEAVDVADFLRTALS